MTKAETRERTTSTGESGPIPIAVLVALGTAACVVAWVSVVGSDSLWLSALGDTIRADRQIPVGVPFAAAPSGEWVNTTALGQLVFSVLYLGGSIGIVAAQVVAVTWTLWLLVTEAGQRGSRALGTVSALLLVLVGGAAPLLIARAQLLSLVPYAALLVLVRREHDRPSRLIWMAVPLIALWGNLHGAVLVGVAVLGCYLAFSRLRRDPWTAVGVGFAALAAACLNPGLLRAPRYYIGVFTGAATSDDSGMWSRLSLSNIFDVLLLVASICLGYMAFRRRRPLWEYAAALGLAGATVLAARHGIWLMLILLVPAALSMPSRGDAAASEAPSTLARAATIVACVVVAACLLGVRAPTFRAADAEAARLADATRGEVVLVAEPLAESMAAAGTTVWVSNPLDAFDHADQTAYLAFMNGDAAGAARALAQAEVVVALPGSAQAAAAQATGLTQGTKVGTYALFRRSSG
ncbi:hypothetical protein [Terrabacter sp. Root181]|uniref:hypothetical protein n=1 Tax=Terrabacter sp. Root181 TaxID=1736484 RepID=UPI0006F84748|nr:hypothetical protein [Terrabacter sp. Root181]KRB43868.1 hypothetical protein ASD90_19835 [Terrabacter sp. Root181]